MSANIKRDKPYKKILIAHDIVVKMPPKRKLSIKARIIRIQKAEPRVVIPEQDSGI